MLERAVWWLGLLALGIALAACDGDPDAPEPTTTPAPTAMPTATPTAIATPPPTPTAAPPTPTAAPPTPTTTPAATTSPASDPVPQERWQPDIVEVDTDLFERLTYETGETITEYGLFFLDIETGRVEGWRQQGVDVPFGGRFLGLRNGGFGPLIAPYLHDRRSGRTFAWDWEAWPLEEFATERGERLIVERADASPGQYVVLDGDLNPITWFNLPTGGQDFRVNPEGDRALALGDGALHVIGLVSGQTLHVEIPAGIGPLHVSGYDVVPEKVSIFPEGFAFIGRDMNGKEQCRVVRYDWAATMMSDIAFRCAGVRPPISLSPNGRMIASETFTDTYPDRGLGDYYALTVISVFDTRTGEELIRAVSVLLDFPVGSLGLVHPTPWIADSSGIIVTVSEPTSSGVQRRSRILGIDGRWHPSPSMLDEPLVHEGWFPPYMVSASHDPSLFLLIRGKVVSRNSEVLASFNIDFPAILPEYGFVCYGTWWNTPKELAMLVRECGHTSWSLVLPMLPPGIKTPPFDERLLMTVITGETCVDLREEPSAEATRIACLPNGTVVELLASDGVESYADGYPVTIISNPDYFVWGQPDCRYGSGHDACVWLHVRDAEGAEGWMLTDSLRWAP